MIVQCPACETRFSIEDSLIAGRESSRFHCSRCDNYFESVFNLAGSTPATPSTGDTQPLQLRSQSATQLDLLSSSQTFRPITVPVINSTKPESSTPSHPAPSPLPATLYHSDETQPIAIEWPSHQADEVREVDMSEMRARLAGSLSGDYAPNVEASMLELPLTERDNSGSWTLGLSTPTPNFSTDTQSDELAEPLPPRVEVDRQGVIRVSSLPDKRAISAAFPTRIGWFSRLKGALADSINSRFVDISPKQFLAAARPVVGVLALPCALTFGFGMWGAELGRDPRELPRSIATLLPPIPRIAPAGLELTDIQSEQLFLDSGEKVLEIRGSLFNTSTESISGIRLEAKLFSHSNELLREVIAKSNNSLSQSGVLTALRAEMIASLQDREGLMPELKSGSTQQFRLVFTNPPQEATWFSARIRSVAPRAAI